MEINKEALAKVVKAGILVAGMLGYNVSPEQIQAIAELAGGAVSVVYILEALWKSKKS